ncbi:hypothetical protein D3C87_1682740 [compost metagenome]
MRKLLGARSDRDLLLLLANAFDFGNRFDRTENVFQFLGIIFQLRIGGLVAFNADHQCFGIPEIGVHNRAADAFREIHLLGYQQLVPEFAPKNVGVLHVFTQLHIHDHHAVLRGRVGFVLADFFELEKVLFEFFGDLVFYLGGIGAREKG